MTSNELLEAYKKAIYQFTDASDKSYIIKLDEANPEIDELLGSNGAKSWSFITPFNPYSKELSDEENSIRLTEFKQLLDTDGYKYLLGQGSDAIGLWKPEISLFILDVNKQTAIKYGARYEQNAILIGEVNQPAKLEINDYEKSVVA